MNLFKRISELEMESHTPFALCTVVETKGSSPRKSGRMLVFESGAIEGTIGGGPAEWHVINEARKLMKLGQSKLVEVILDKNHPEGLEMTCGGQMKVHIETFLPKPKLFLIGAGHVNLAIFNLALNLDLDLVIVDDREETLAKEVFSQAKNIVVAEDIAAAVAKARPLISEKDFVVIATKDNDEAALKALLLQSCHYIGLIGSRRKCQLIKANLAQSDADLLWLEEVHMPVGLDLGGQTPEEIAISVMAEILKSKYKKMAKPLSEKPTLVLIRGAGDLATGVAVRLFKSGFHVVMSEIERPTCIRHEVAFASAVFKGRHHVEGVEAILCESLQEVSKSLTMGKIPVFTKDEASLYRLKPQVFIEATIRKEAIDVNLSLAPLTLGLGPGFTAGVDVHGVIETNRGHYLGSVIWQGKAEADTAIPGNIGGYTHERVIKAPESGIFVPIAKIGTSLVSGDVIGYLELGESRGGERLAVTTQISGVLRGILFEPMAVTKGFKIADVDPRAELAHCFTVSDKARSIGGGVLEAICEKYPKTLNRG